jgi:putative phosphoribosyl transferase
LLVSGYMPVPTRFRDRRSAGSALAPRVREVTTPPTVVLGLPRGGVVVASAIAEALGAPLCAAWVRKLVSPREPDVVFGAVDVDGDVTLSTEIARAEGLGDDDVAEIAYHAHQSLLGDWERAPGLDATALLPGATAAVIDDCVSTGLSLRAAMRWARRQLARHVVLAVPVVDRLIWEGIASDADSAVTLDQREGPVARSEVYHDYRRVADGDLAAVLAAARADMSAASVAER